MDGIGDYVPGRTDDRSFFENPNGSDNWNSSLIGDGGFPVFAFAGLDVTYEDRIRMDEAAHTIQHAYYRAEHDELDRRNAEIARETAELEEEIALYQRRQAFAEGAGAAMTANVFADIEDTKEEGVLQEEKKEAPRRRGKKKGKKGRRKK